MCPRSTCFDLRFSTSLTWCQPFCGTYVGSGNPWGSWGAFASQWLGRSLSHHLHVLEGDRGNNRAPPRCSPSSSRGSTTRPLQTKAAPNKFLGRKSWCSLLGDSLIVPLGGHVPLPRPARRPLRPEGAPRRGWPLRPPFPQGPRLVAGHPDRVELHFLPSYSPELNPDEVNADLKRSLPMHSRAPGPGPTRRRDPPVLPPPPTSATHRPRLLRRPTRPLHPRIEPIEFRINMSRSKRSASSAPALHAVVRKATCRTTDVPHA